MTVLLSLTRRRALAPEARLGLEAELPDLPSAHLTMPAECRAFAEALDSDPEVDTVLVARRLEGAASSVRVMRVRNAGRWSASHWRF